MKKHRLHFYMFKDTKLGGRANFSVVIECDGSWDDIEAIGYSMAAGTNHKYNWQEEVE